MNFTFPACATRRPLLAAFLIAVLAPASAISAKPIILAQANTPGTPVLLGQFDAWGAYTVTNGDNRTCYVLAKPFHQETKPAGRSRDPAYMFVSIRPAEKISNEVSVVMGYPLKPGADASAQVDTASFALFTQDDGAWIKNAGDEPKLIDAMRKGSEMTVKGTSTHGTLTTDKYSLKGISQALDRIAQACK